VAGRYGSEAVQSARRHEEANDTAGVSLAPLGLGVGFGFEVLDGLCLCILNLILFYFGRVLSDELPRDIKLI